MPNEKRRPAGGRSQQTQQTPDPNDYAARRIGRRADLLKVIRATALQAAGFFFVGALRAVDSSPATSSLAICGASEIHG